MQVQLLRAPAGVCWGAASPRDAWSLGALPEMAKARRRGAGMLAASPPGPALGWPPAMAVEKWLLPSRCSPILEAHVCQLLLPCRWTRQLMKTSQLWQSSGLSPRGAHCHFPIRIISSFTSAGAA